MTSSISSCQRWRRSRYAFSPANIRQRRPIQASSGQRADRTRNTRARVATTPRWSVKFARMRSRWADQNRHCRRPLCELVMRTLVERGGYVSADAARIRQAGASTSRRSLFRSSEAKKPITTGFSGRNYRSRKPVRGFGPSGVRISPSPSVSLSNRSEHRGDAGSRSPL